MGEGWQNRAFGSKHWVVKKPRRFREMLAIQMVSKLSALLRKFLPNKISSSLVVTERVREILPSDALIVRGRTAIRITLQILLEVLLTLIPRFLLDRTKTAQLISETYQGERLAMDRLSGTGLIPKRVHLGAAWVKVKGFRGNV